TSFAGDGIAATNSGVATAHSAIAVDQTGNVYFADLYMGRIRRVDATTGLIYTVAGNGNSNSSSPSPDGTPANAAVLPQILNIAISPSGLLFSDYTNRVRRVDLLSPGSYTATSVSVNPTTANTSDSFTFTATVAPAAGGPATGSVTF